MGMRLPFAHYIGSLSMHKDHPRETMATANIKPHSVDGVDLAYWAELIREHGSAAASCSIAAATNRARTVEQWNSQKTLGKVYLRRTHTAKWRRSTRKYLIKGWQCYSINSIKKQRRQVVLLTAHRMELFAADVCPIITKLATHCSLSSLRGVK